MATSHVGDQSLAEPRHIGNNIFPNFPIFVRLLFFAHNHTSIAVNDVTNNLQGTHAQLLSDVLHLRNSLRDSLDYDTRRKLLTGEQMNINLLAPGGYEFAAGFLAVVALGAVVVPICKSVR